MLSFRGYPGQSARIAVPLVGSPDPIRQLDF
jgi:hypothetical protein